MTQIENRFQEVVQPITEGLINTIAPDHKPAIDAMFALWLCGHASGDLLPRNINCSVFLDTT
jgi:hypothetical protein